MKRLLLVPLVLVGCAGITGTPRPAGVTLTHDTLQLMLDDGTRCRVDWTAAPVGQMDRCGPGFGYAVTVNDRKNIARQLAEEVDLALGTDAIPPMAGVVITDPAGVDYVFTLLAPSGTDSRD